jgi:hypothetical protein
VAAACPNAFCITINGRTTTFPKRYAHQESWIMASVVLAWRRANKGHTFNDSVLALLPDIVAMTDRPCHWPENQPFPAVIDPDRFIGSRFARSDPVVITQPPVGVVSKPRRRRSRRRWATTKRKN